MASVIKAGNATDGVQVTSDNTGILELKTGTGAGTTAMTVDTSQNVGIGTSSPVGRLNVVSTGGNSRLSIGDTASSTYSTLLMYGGSGKYNFQLGVQNLVNNAFEITPSTTVGGTTFSTPAFLIDSSGNVGIGTTSPGAKLEVLTASTGNTIQTAASFYYPNNTGGGASGPRIDFAANNSASARVVYSSIWSLIGSNSAHSGDLVFATASSGTVTERARITSGGYFKASNSGAYQDSNGAYHEMYQTTASDPIAVFRANSTSYAYGAPGAVHVVVNRNTSNNSYYYFGCYNTALGATKFTIADSGNATNTNGSYGTISDAKMKTDIVDAGSQWNDIKAIRFRKFKMIGDPEQIVQLGVIAQEIEQVSPGLVEEHKDTDVDGNDLGTTTKSVKTSILYMKATVALQEAMTRIESLEAEVAALKGAAQ